MRKGEALRAGPGAGRWLVFAALALVAQGLACRTVAPPPSPTPAPRPSATPAAAPATPAPTPAPTPEPPAAPARADLAPPLVRVLLSSGPDAVLPDPGRRYTVVFGDRRTTIRGPLRVSATPGRAVVQAGAFSLEDNARALAERLRGAALDARVERGDDGLFRVVAAGAEGAAASALRDRLTGLGITGATVRGVVGGAVTLIGEDGAELTGAELRLVPVDAVPVRVGDGRYRGEFVVEPAERGVAVVDVLSLEQYLRGVVPAEMGPRSFPALEALKAQAVAARTYVVAHLHEHDAEGYDICATQACQVYGGADVEHPLSDRAVAETSGQILVYDGKPIDAMYQSTCGGHTEDAALVMPERAAPYLRGVPCRAESDATLGLGQPRGPWIDSVDHLAEIGERVGAALGLRRVTAGALVRAFTGRAARPGTAGLLAGFQLEDAMGLLHGQGGESEDERVLTLLETFHLTLPPRPPGPAAVKWELAAAVRLAQLAGDLEAFSGRIVAAPAGYRVVNDRSDTPRDLTGRETVFEQRGEAWRRGATVAPMGSPATVWCARGVCSALDVEPRTEADAGSAWGWWVREIPLGAMSEKLGLSRIASVRVTKRGPSGRALAIALDTSSGRRELAGFPFRRALALPDTLFTVTVRQTAAGPVAHFVGRGWGHGIGMCQNGAYGLAQGGARYDEILRAYYTGVALAHWGEPAGGSR